MAATVSAAGFAGWLSKVPGWLPHMHACMHACRVEGPRHGVARAVGIMCDAVGRYKELCEGRFSGESLLHCFGVALLCLLHSEKPTRSSVRGPTQMR